jgi:RNA polymerase sigma-70 factor (ECF subfamily)
MCKEELCGYFPKYKTYLYRLAYARLHNWMDTEDAVQAAFIRAWMYCECLEKEASFPTWLMRILVNECNNILRKKKRTSEVYMEDELLRLPSAPDDMHIIKMDLFAALDTLEDRYRIPIQMIFFYGFTSEETAARLHMTRSAVSGMVRRGKERLRAAM